WSPVSARLWFPCGATALRLVLLWMHRIAKTGGNSQERDITRQPRMAENQGIARKASIYGDHKVAVAPMMDWTDRHCRFFHRQLTARALLYTEMVVADAAIHGVRERLLGFDAAEQPVALQLGGSEPAKLAEAARIGEGFGY